MSKAEGKTSFFFLEVPYGLRNHPTLLTNVYSIRSSGSPREPGQPFIGRTASTDLSVTFGILDSAESLKFFHPLISEIGVLTPSLSPASLTYLFLVACFPSLTLP